MLNDQLLPRIRDAARSREAILDAAERLFSERDYDAASLHEIAAAAGLSRGTPSYFFGSKERLYREVLDRVFRERQAAVAPAFHPVHEWIAAAAGLPELRGAMACAAEVYMRFLLDRPSYGRLMLREELAGGDRLRARTEGSTAALGAFRALRRAASPQLAKFDVHEAVLLFTVLTFGPVSYRNTLMHAVERDLENAAALRTHIELVAAQMMRLLAR